MLLGVVNRKNIDQWGIIYFEFPISLLDRDDVVFTDASANTALPPNFYSEPTDLNKLNWAEIDSRKWSSANATLRHQRMAEVLVHSHLDLKEASRVIVWNNGVKGWVQETVNEAGVPFPQIEFESPNRRHYFLKFMFGEKTSLVSGPVTIANEYNLACKKIAEEAGQFNDAPFETPKKLLKALREDFSSLPYTSELIGLKSANGMHKFTVDHHIFEVVNKLKSLPEFKALSPEDRDRVELAAYLHNIGKGPKARWAQSGGLQEVDPDHPIRAMPMMVDIMTKQVRKVRQENARLIVKLVCYHDLVGEVMGKGRDERQIVDVTESEEELDMLFALGKADATSLCEEWWDDDESTNLYERCLKAIKHIVARTPALAPCRNDGTRSGNCCQIAGVSAEAGNRRCL